MDDPMKTYGVLVVSPDQPQVGLIPGSATDPTSALIEAARFCQAHGLNEASLVGALTREDLLGMVQAIDDTIAHSVG